MLSMILAASLSGQYESRHHKPHPAPAVVPATPKPVPSPDADPVLPSPQAAVVAEPTVYTPAPAVYLYTAPLASVACRPVVVVRRMPRRHRCR